MLWSCANGILLVDSVIMFREVMQVELIGLCVISCVCIVNCVQMAGGSVHFSVSGAAGIGAIQ